MVEVTGSAWIREDQLGKLKKIADEENENAAVEYTLDSLLSLCLTQGIRMELKRVADAEELPWK